MIHCTRNSRIQVKRINQSFRESITNISHDLRTPLTSANGYIQLLQDSVNDKEQKGYLRIVFERQQLVQRLLNQLFEYVRIESGELVYEKVPVDVKNVFVETLLLFYDDFNRYGTEPEVSLPEYPCMVLGDEQGLRRTFSNILFNALTHGQCGYRFSLTENNGYLLTISNQSAPLTQEELENVFNRFYTKDKSRNKKTTGLGLAIAKEIVKQMDDDGNITPDIRKHNRYCIFFKHAMTNLFCIERCLSCNTNT